MPPPHGWYSGPLKVIFILGVVIALLVIASVLARQRGASTELRRFHTPVAVAASTLAAAGAVQSAATAGAAGGGPAVQPGQV
jgi:hypothetical protein